MKNKVLHVFTIVETPKAFFDNQFKFLSDNGLDIHLSTNSAEDAAFSKRNEITYHQVSILRKISPMADLSSIKKLVSLIKKEDFDTVVGHTPKGAMVAMIASKLAGVKHRIYYRHGLIYTTATGTKRKILKLVEQLTGACASLIINVSPSLNELAIKDHLNSSKKQKVIGAGTCGGIDTKNVFNPELISENDKAALKSSLGISEDEFIVGFCGRICKEKGIRELIDGFKEFHSQHPHSKLLLVGPYDARDILPEEYKKEIESNPAIINTGRIEKAKLPLYYSLMELFVFPSYREGFGMCVLEASAMKVPILVSRAHGCIDSIREHVTGEYIDISSEGVLDGLEKMSDDSLRRKMGENGRKFVVENFDYKILWPKILKEYIALSE